MPSPSVNDQEQKPSSLEELREEFEKIYNKSRQMGMLRTGSPIEYAVDASIEVFRSHMEAVIDENTSDGYHTFKELYEYRMLYNAALFNEWAKQGLYNVHKSNKHSDGQFCFGGGWFVVVAELPTGQITNHYETKDWGLFKVPVLAIATEWDGHTPEDVAKRLKSYLEGEKTDV